MRTHEDPVLKLFEPYFQPYVSFLYRHRYPLFILFFILISFLIYNASTIEVNTSRKAFYYEDDPLILFNEQVDSAFESQDIMTIFIRINNSNTEFERVHSLNDPYVKQYVTTLKQKLMMKPFVDKVQTFLDNKGYISKDNATTLILINLNAGKSDKYINQRRAELQEIIDNTGRPTGLKVSLGGEAVLMSEIGRIMLSDLLKTGFLSMLSIFIIIKLLMRNNHITIFAVLLSAVTVFSILGTMHIFGMSLNLATALIAAITIGIGVDYSLHLLSGFYAFKSVSVDSVVKTLRHTTPSLTMSFVTTAIGFISLAFAGSKMLFELAIVTTLGIFFVFFYNHSLLIILYFIFDKSKTQKQKPKQSFLHNIKFPFLNTSRFIAQKPLLFIFLILIFTIFIAFGNLFLDVQTSYSDFLPSSNPVVKDFLEQQDAFPSTYSHLTIVAIGDDVLDPAFLKQLDKVEKQIKSLEFITGAHSIVDKLRTDNNGSLPDVRTNIKSPLVSKDLHFAKLNVYYGGQASGDIDVFLYNMIPKLEEKLPDNFRLSGTTALTVRQRQIMKSGQKQVSLFSLLLIFFLFILYFRNFVYAIIVLVPVVLSFITTPGLDGWTGVPFNQMSASIFGMIAGLGIDFAIHTINSMKKSLQNGKTYQQAVEHLFSSLGLLLFITSTTTILGFLSLQFADLSFLRDLGLSLAFGILLSFIYAIIFLPALIILEDKVFHSFHK